MKIFKKIVAGGPDRKTRFHDEKGNLLDLVGMSYAPRTFCEAAFRVAFGLRPELPWISYRATRTLDLLLQPSWRVAEFGSGMSTLWFARRVAFVLSVEAYPQWYAIVGQRLVTHRLSHVRHELRTPKSYSDLSEFDDGYFDFVLVDGEMRSECVRKAVPKIRRGGWMYLDNTDKPGDLAVAEAEMLRAVRERGGSCEYFTDLVPTQLIATQGMLARL